eukprot:CAMPEP_0119333138 /NCGR_PEP_ID=MMETSP1333-20130426/84448_1 /TAXON_ID=418940 /ORGANISM="Scyphosphaera apsteinii, Strain RCC1455" /LENGTH=83 /DNA_ID=CAMNT_0007343111 /DNA_START=51 /DNA_END=299 /DNA_ORIENTATION=-
MSEQNSLLQRAEQEQDHELDKLGKGVERVKALSSIMREELKDQAKILDDLDSDVEKADASMHSMGNRMRALAEQTKSSERAQW